MKQNRNQWLFVVFCFFAARGIAAGRGNEDAGSGAQPDIDLRPCHAPAYSDARRIQTNATDDDREKLVNEGRCYLLCTTEKFKVLS